MIINEQQDRLRLVNRRCEELRGGEETDEALLLEELTHTRGAQSDGATARLLFPHTSVGSLKESFTKKQKNRED